MAVVISNYRRKNKNKKIINNIIFLLWRPNWRELLPQCPVTKSNTT